MAVPRFEFAAPFGITAERMRRSAVATAIAVLLTTSLGARAEGGK